jgi:predicted MFS family arabinose efflux permease
VEQLLETGPTEANGSSRISIWKSPTSWLLEKKLSRGFWVFFSVAFFFDFGFSVYVFLFNLYLLDFHFNERTIGLVGGAATLGSVIGTLPAGWIARRTGLRPLLAVCLIASPLLGVARTLAMWQSAQIGLAFLAGLGMCLWGVCFLPALARLTTEENRASAFSLIFSVGIGTTALGGVVCGYLPQWLKMAGFAMQAVEVKRLILMVSCGIAAVGLIPLLRLRLPPPEGESQTESKTSKQPWKMNPFLLRFLPAMALWAAVLGAFTPFANVYLSKDLHIPMAQIGLIFSAAQIIQLCMTLLTPLVFRRMGLVNGIVATQVATAAALGCLAGTHDRGLTVALYLSFSAVQWMSAPGLYNLLMSRVPDEERSSASAMTLFCNALLGSGATAGAGILFVRFGYPHVLSGIAILALTAAILLGTLMSPRRRRTTVGL